MSEFFDLLKIASDDPEYLKTILADKTKLAKYELTSAELNIIKKLDPEIIRVILSGIEDRLRIRPAASSQACTGGTNACVGRTMPDISPETATARLKR